MLAIAVWAMLAACSKNQDTVPRIGVNTYVYVNNPLNIRLNAPGGWIYVNDAGVRGIIVYRKSMDEFLAFDRNCTYQSSNSCATISVDSSQVFASDNCCGSQFNIQSGMVTRGPATQPLIQYRTSFDGSAVHIYN